VRTLQAALAPLDDDDETPTSRGLVRLYMALVDPLYSLNRFEDALTAGWRALELARQVGDQGLIARATVGHGLALHGIGRLDEARAVLEDAVPLAEAWGDLAGLAEGLTRTGDIYITQGRPERGREYYERALDVEERRGNSAGIAALLSRVGDAVAMLGDWEAAGTYFERSVDLARSVSFSHFSASVAMRLGEYYLYRGEDERALRFVEEALTIAKQSGQTHQLRYLQVTPAAWDLFEGRAEESLQRLAPLLDTPIFETTLDHRAMQIAAEAYIALSDPRAQALVRAGLAQAVGQSNHLARLGWLQTAGLLAAKEDRDTALDILRDALALARSMPDVFAEANVLCRRGTIRGDEGGQHDLEAALALFARLGARPFAHRVEREITTLTDNRTALFAAQTTAP
jgi:tetratricopeptide (TPR) repeat protein